VNILPYRQFEDFDAAIAYVRENPRHAAAAPVLDVLAPTPRLPSHSCPPVRVE